MSIAILCLHFASDFLQSSDLDLITQELSVVNQKWKSIGRELMHSEPRDCLKEVLREQLKKLHHTTTWRNIVDILRTSSVAWGVSTGRSTKYKILPK